MILHRKISLANLFDIPSFDLFCSVSMVGQFVVSFVFSGVQLRILL